MRIDDGFDDGKPQSGAIALTVARRIDAVKTIKQSRDVLRRNLFSGIVNNDTGSVCACLQPHLHRLIGGCVTDGVQKEVTQRPAQHQPIAWYVSWRTFQHECDAALFCPCLKVVEERPYLRNQVYIGQTWLQQTVVGLCQKQHIADHLGHAFIFFERLLARVCRESDDSITKL